MLKREFYRQCYMQTEWIPMQPLTRSVGLGDVCQIHQGYFQPLMNLTEIHLVEDILVSEPIMLNPMDWRMSSGVQQTYSATEHIGSHGDTADSEDLELIDWTRQQLSFEQPGSYVFHGDEANCRLIMNWHKLKDDVTLKLTQTHYGFRELYVVTGVATLNNWGLALSGGHNAQLDMAAATRNTDLFALISHETARADQCKNIAAYEKSHRQPAYFFKAKRLILSDEVHDRYMCRLLDNDEELSDRSIANWLNCNLLNLIKSNEFNLATSISYFNWADASLDDVERLLV